MALKVRVDKLDILFSKYIRLRDKVCRKCGRPGREVGGTWKLECCHWKRGINALRYDDKSCFTLCFLCHQELDHDRPAKTAFWLEQMGQKEFDMMLGRERERWRLDREAIKLYLQQQIAELAYEGR